MFGPNQVGELMIGNAVATETTVATFIATASDKELKVLSKDGSNVAAGKPFFVLQKATEAAGGFEFSDKIDPRYIDKITVEGFDFDRILQEVRCDDWARYSDGSPGATLDPLYGNYVCWNERWYLPIRLPAFTWLHKLENLGWIYGDTI